MINIDDNDKLQKVELKHEPRVVEPTKKEVEKPKVEEPKVEEPKVEEPKVEEPKVEEPKVEEPKEEVEETILPIDGGDGKIADEQLRSLYLQYAKLGRLIPILLSFKSGLTDSTSNVKNIKKGVTEYRSVLIEMKATVSEKIKSISGKEEVDPRLVGTAKSPDEEVIAGAREKIAGFAELYIEALKVQESDLKEVAAFVKLFVLGLQDSDPKAIAEFATTYIEGLGSQGGNLKETITSKHTTVGMEKAKDAAPYSCIR